MPKATSGADPRFAPLLLLAAGIAMAGVALLAGTDSCAVIPDWLCSRSTPSRVAVARERLAIASGVLLALAALLRFQPGLAARPAVVRVCLLLCTLLAPLYALDRLAQIVRPETRAGSPYVADVALGWRLRSSIDVEYGGVRLRTNRFGLRSRETTLEKPAGTTRVLFLGDSVTQGFGLEAEDVFAPIVERQLHERGHPDVEAINAGISAYSTWQQERYLRDEGIRFDPDIVVLGFVLNDVTEPFSLTRFGGTTSGHLVARNAGSLARVLSGHVPTIAIALEILPRWLLGPEARGMHDLGVSELFEETPSAFVDKAWAVTLDSLDQLVRFCEQKGVGLLLVAYPLAQQVEGLEDRDRPQRILRAFANERGVPFLDVLPLMQEAPIEPGELGEGWFMDALHLSPRGSQRIAEPIAQQLEPLLAERQSPRG